MALPPTETLAQDWVEAPVSARHVRDAGRVLPYPAPAPDVLQASGSAEQVRVGGQVLLDRVLHLAQLVDVEGVQLAPAIRIAVGGVVDHLHLRVRSVRSAHAMRAILPCQGMRPYPQA